MFPAASVFSDPLGRIILCNIKMQELSRMLTGTYLQNYEFLRHAIHADSRQKDVIQLSSDNHVFYFPDGSVWMFQEYPLKEPSLDGYLQTVAVNVSEIYYNGEEIKNNNEKLEFLNRRLEEMYEKIGDEIREQETLSMKMQVHDSFGRSLLSIRRILEKKEEPENMKEQLDTLKQLDTASAGGDIILRADKVDALRFTEAKAAIGTDRPMICHWSTSPAAKKHRLPT